MDTSVIWMILFLVCIVGTHVCYGQTNEEPKVTNCSSVPPPCGENQYCISDLSSAVCEACDPSCVGCNSFGNTQCKECKDGYHNVSDVCLQCPDNTFGPQCNGTCHCLHGAKDCNQQNGECISFSCAQGWTGLPQCQEPCSNRTFGSGCTLQCHCPPNDVCASTNGLCTSGSCAEGWSSAGCQNELPQLADPPVVQNVTCANVTLTWLAWRRNIDRGNPDGIIRRYELQALFSTDTSFAAWSNVKNIPHVEGQSVYVLTLTDLVPDAFYRFRVDVRQSNGDKIMNAIFSGKASNFVKIPCTEPTTTATVTPPPFTTARPLGPHLLDDSKFKVVATDSTPRINVSWALIPTISVLINVTLTYQLTAIGNCHDIEGEANKTIPVPSEGQFEITDMLPWHNYKIQVTAHSYEYDISDYIGRDFLTPEVAPSEINSSSIQIKLLSKTGGQLSWSMLPCDRRGGVLLYYRVDIYTLSPTLTKVLSERSNSTTLSVETLTPATRYGVAVLYVNSVGESPSPQNLTQFETLEDVPEAPSIQSVTASSDSINITLLPPLVSNGELVDYTVSWSESLEFTVSQAQTQVVGLGTSVVVTNLKPDTFYHIKARASTKIGPGPYSSVVNVTTTQSVPAPPTDVNVDASRRNETCVYMSWQHTSTSKVAMLGFNVSYTVSDNGQPQKVTTFTEQPSLLVCNLTPGRYYTFEIIAINEIGPSQPITISVYTEHSDPPVPPIPVVMNTTETTISIALDPVVLVPSSISYNYMVFIHDVTKNVRKKRALSTSNTTCPGLDELPGRLVRNFTQLEIPSRTIFIIGDGQIYGDYNNSALLDKHYYDIYYVISSYFEGVCKYSYVKRDQPVQAVTAPVVVPPVTQVEESSNNVTLVIVIVVICILIIVAVIIILLCWWFRIRNREQNYVPYQNEKEDFNLKVVHIVDDYDPMKYWNTIHSLRESRYVTAGRELVPDDTHGSYMNGSVPTADIANGEKPLTFQYEFSQLPHNKTSTCEVALQRDNELKNRFTHLLPYDHSRVILDPDVNDDGNYINANFIKGYKHQRAYIAAQSPFERDTVLDFWRMIYQYEVHVVVMMSKIVEDNIVKCTQYWPDEGRVKYEQFILDLVSVQEYADYVIRRVDVWTSADKRPQQVYIFDLNYWPDHGVPDDPIPLLEMRTKVNAYHNKHPSPIVVHCGTGVSRTGVYIAIDSLIEQYEAEGRISVFSFVRKMRKDRPAMVRTLKQYVFIYEAVFEAMVAGDTRVGVSEMKETYDLLAKKNHKTKHSFLHGQFKCLQEYTRKIFPAMCSHACVPANSIKNRFYDVVPRDDCRPILTTPGGYSRTDYINAVMLDGHRADDHFIVTQTPLHTTIIDFWKLVYDYDVSTIVMMEPMKFEDDTSADYWPEEQMKQFEPFFVETTEVYQQENITIRNFTLTYMDKPKEHRFIRQFQFNAWSDSEFIPKSKSMLLDVIDLVRDWQEVSNGDTKPMIVHCKDGATHSGLFVAVNILCDKALDEGEVDIFHTVKHLKRRRTQIIDTLDQYRFCYKALWDFINMRMPGGTLTDRMSQTRSDQPYGSISMYSDRSNNSQRPY